MTQTLARAYTDGLARRREREATARATICIEGMGAARKIPEFVGIATIDGCWRRDMYSGQRTEFPVETGEHRVTVYLARRYRVVGYGPRAEASLNVVVAPGEQLDLVYGVRRDWETVEAVIFWPTFLFFACSVLAFGIGWHVSPLLQPVVTFTIAALGMQHPWRSVFGFFVSSREVTAFAAMYAGFIVGLIVLNRLARRLQLQMMSVVSPYVLMRRCDLGKQTARPKELYVDPLE